MRCQHTVAGLTGMPVKDVHCISVRTDTPVVGRRTREGERDRIEGSAWGGNRKRGNCGLESGKENVYSLEENRKGFDFSEVKTTKI